MAYNNLAYDYNNLARIEQENEQMREEKKRLAKKQKLKERKRLNFFVICAVVAISFSAYFMISKNVEVYETQAHIESLQKELNMLESTTSQKIFELEQSVDLNAVEQIAMTRLNMQRPEKYQIVYINVQTDDVTDVTAKNKEKAPDTDTTAQQ